MNPKQRLLLLFLLLCFAAFSQDVIFLENPSFEDSPEYAHTPVGWVDCGFFGETPVDLHPLEGGIYGVTQKPFDGLTYLGMVVRDNSTYEGIGQQLSSPLLPGQCYQFEIYLCRSETYNSFSRVTNAEANFSMPATFVVLGGNDFCDRSTFLAKSQPVVATQWKKYRILFQPTDTVSFLILEAFYSSGDDPHYNGNILVDNASPIIRIDCENYKPVVNPDSIVQPAFHLPEKVYKHKKEPSDLDKRIVFYRVSTSEELGVLLQKNCPSILFPEGEAVFGEPAYTALREVAYNVKQFHYLRLFIFLETSDKQLIKQRIRAIKEELKIMRLPQRQYRIITKNRPGKNEGLLCKNAQIAMGLELR